MVELHHTAVPRRVALVLSAALLIGGPASGQGPFPPVPGPFAVLPGAQLAPQTTAPAAPGPATETVVRPMFQPPANAIRMPYWMQAPVATAPAADRGASAGTAQAAPRQAPDPGQVAAPQAPVAGFVQQMPFWQAAPYGGTGFGAQGSGAARASGGQVFGGQGYNGPTYGPAYGAQAPWPGQAPAGTAPAYAAPGYIPPGYAPSGAQSGGSATAPAPVWGTQPGWGYAPAPGWAPMPFAPVWGMPTMGAGQ